MKFIKVILFIIPIALIGISNSVSANIIKLQHHIEKVTVFPRNAMITRMASMTLTPGDHVLVFNNLPATMHHKSLRVSGQGIAKVLIGSVERKQLNFDELVQDKEKELNFKILELQDEKMMLNNDIEALNLQLEFIKNIGQNIPKSINDEIKINTINPKIWKEAWNNIGTGASDTFKVILEKNQKLRQVSKKISTLQQQLNKIQTGNRSVSQARININVQQGGEFTILLDYQMSGATWQAVYDARLNIDKEKIALTQFGQVRQQTGENWNNVKLTLSTVKPSLGARMPELQPWFVKILHPVNYRSTIQKNLSKPIAAFEDSVLEAESVSAYRKRKHEFKYAQQSISGFTAEYHVSGRSTITADNSPQKFSINKIKLLAKLSARVVPKRNLKAYLYAETLNTGSAPLLAGQVSLFRDNTYIGNLLIAAIQPSEKFKLSFGVDDRIKVKYRMINNTHSENGFLTTNNVINRLYHTEITNHHTKPFNIEMLEHIPVSQDENIKVELSDDTTEPTETNSEDRPGVLAWRYLYKANSKKRIAINYQITYPKDQIIQGL